MEVARRVADIEAGATDGPPGKKFETGYTPSSDVTRPTKLLAEARLEIEETFDWYLERSSRAAEGFLREVERGIATTTSMWKEWSGSKQSFVRTCRSTPLNSNKR